MTTRRVYRIGLGISALAVGLLWSADAGAHFVLQAPAALTEQDGLGNPQKAPKCGDPGGAALTGEVTAYQAGDTITITINETIYHPGHYRVALALTDESELPEAPTVTPAGGDDCAMTEIQDPPVFPVLADGELVHDASFDGPQSFEVTLPDDVECENCILQVIEFMSSHGAPCFYYHCATISIEAAPSMTSGDTSGSTGDVDPSTTGDSGATTSDSSGNNTTDDTANGETSGGSASDTTPDTTTGQGDTDSGTGGGTDSSAEDSEDDGGGCGCTTSAPDGREHGAALLALVGLWGLRRRR